MIEHLPIEAMGFGAPVREFTVRRTRRAAMTLLSGSFILLGVAFVLGLLFGVQVGPDQHVEALIFDAIFAAPVAALSALLIRQLVTLYTLRVALYPSGMIVWRRGTATVVRWQQVESVRVVTRRDGNALLHLLLFHLATLLYLLSRLSPRQTYTLRLLDGTSLKIPTILTGAVDLGAIVERETAAALFPRARATYDGGGTLAFGVVTVSRAGVQVRNKLLAWSDLDRAELRGGQLRIYRRGRRRRWAAVPTGKAPNLYLLRMLLMDTNRLQWPELSA